MAPYDARAAYRARLKLYLNGQPFLTGPPPAEQVEQAVYGASDR